MAAHIREKTVAVLLAMRRTVYLPKVVHALLQINCYFSALILCVLRLDRAVLRFADRGRLAFHSIWHPCHVR